MLIIIFSFITLDCMVTNQCDERKYWNWSENCTKKLDNMADILYDLIQKDGATAFREWNLLVWLGSSGRGDSVCLFWIQVLLARMLHQAQVAHLNYHHWRACTFLIERWNFHNSKNPQIFIVIYLIAPRHISDPSSNWHNLDSGCLQTGRVGIK